MKKVYLIGIAITLLLLTGCGNTWKSKIQASNFKIEDDHIVGKLKNTTEKAYDMKIIFTLKSGNLSEEEVCYELIKPKETIDIKCIATEYEEYKVKIKNIELTERNARKLKPGKIRNNELEYYFTDIYNEHLLNIASMASETDDSEYPYISKSEYNEDDNIIKIEGKMVEDVGENSINYFSYTEEFNTITNQLMEFHAFIRTDDDDYLSSMQTKIALMKSFNKYGSNSIEIHRALMREDIGLDRCLEIKNEWCVSSKISDGSYMYFISKE